MRRQIIASAAAFGLAATSLMATAPAPQAKGVPAAPHGPKNVIVLIGDGMGYNHANAASLYAKGVSYKQAVGLPGAIQENHGKATFAFQKFPVQVDMATFSVEGSYDPAKAWTDPAYVKNNPTDSAAAGTAMSTGVKTYNAGLGVDKDGNPVENISERALALGKSAGSISSVQYSHATPASYVVHNKSRNDYLGIANQEVMSKMTVVMGAGHPEFNDNGQKLDAPKYKYISEADFGALRQGNFGWSLVESKADFEKLTTGKTPDRVFGIAQVATTLQQSRAGVSKTPYDIPLNTNVPDLATMTKGALNVLDNNPNGFSLMVEGGAIDWAGHGNQGARDIEETLDFNKAIDATIDWVNKNSSWKETLVIVTADHETGYLEGAGAGSIWTPMAAAPGIPAMAYNSGDHTNQLVPVYAIGAGAKELSRRATMTDPVRGAYLDNTELAKIMLDDFWNCQSKGKGKGACATKPHPGKGHGGHKPGKGPRR